MVMKKSDIQDEIMNKIQRKIDKDIERMKSKKDMDKSVEKQIRKQLLDLYLFQSENQVKLEKQKKTNSNSQLQKDVQKNAKKQQKTDEKQQKNSEILSKNSNEYNRLEKKAEKDYYSLSIWKSMSNELRKEHPICQLCGKNKSTEVHHIFPFMHQFEDVREEVFLDKDNLICLCTDCHHQVHANNYGNLGIPERMKIEKLRNHISQKYLNQGKILSWL